MKSLRLIFFYSVFGMLSTHVYSQSKPVAYFQSIIDTTENETIKLNALDSISTFYDKTDRVKSVFYDEQYLTLALKLKRYDKAAESALRISSFYNNIQNDSKKSLDVVNRVLPFIDSLKRSRNKGGLYVKKAATYMNGKDYKKAIKNYNLAIQHYSSKDSIHIGDATYFKAQAHAAKGNYVDAIQSYKASYPYYEHFKDTTYMLYVKNEIAGLYTNLQLNDEATKLLASVEEIAKKGNKVYALIHLKFEQATVFRNKNEIQNEEKVLLQIEKLLHTIEKQNNYDYKYDYTRVYVRLTKLHCKNKNAGKSTYYFNKLETFLTYINKSTYTRLLYLNAKISYSNLIENYPESLTYALEMQAKAHELKNKNEILFAENYLTHIYQKLNKPKKALAHLQTSKKLADSLFKRQNTNTLLYYQTLFKTSEKEKELVKKEKSIQLLEQNKRHTQQILFSSILGIILLFAALFFWLKRKALLKENRLQKNFTSQLLNYQEQEKKRVSENLHDGLGQNLMLIKNKVFLNNDKSTQDLVDNVINEVHHISQALHPFQLEKLGLTQAIKSVIDTANDHSDIFISSEVNDIDTLFSESQELNIYRIIQESINNVIKHAKAEACRVEVLKNETSIFIQIKDNGVGFDFSEEYAKIGSLGLKTLKERIRFLQGSFSFSSEKNEGTDLQITIPI